WNFLVNEMMLWCDYARTHNEKTWHPEGFDFALMKYKYTQDLDNDLHWGDVIAHKLTKNSKMKKVNEKDYIMEELPTLYQQYLHQRNRLFFPTLDQPLQPQEWNESQVFFFKMSLFSFFLKKKKKKSKNPLRKANPSIDGEVRMTTYCLDKTPQWSDDLRVLDGSEHNVPTIVYDYIVTDDKGLLYPNIGHLPLEQQLDLIVASDSSYLMKEMARALKIDPQIVEERVQKQKVLAALHSARRKRALQEKLKKMEHAQQMESTWKKKKFFKFSRTLQLTKF
ncbi:hypothetical protein RFI_03293, partial [Reticulomyxa filosa]